MQRSEKISSLVEKGKINNDMIAEPSEIAEKAYLQTSSPNKTADRNFIKINDEFIAEVTDQISGTVSPASSDSFFCANSSSSIELPFHESRKAGLSFLPIQSKNNFDLRGSYFNLIVAGASGTGKTSFINTLFGCNMLNASRSTSAVAKLYVNDFNLIEDRFKLGLRVIQTTEFGRYIDNSLAWVPITRYIEEQLRLYIYRFEQPQREKIKDSRVHCCLYFINYCGTTLSPLDITTMKQLSARVNLIPVIAKSDTFTSQDLAKYKNIVRQTLQDENISVCDLILDESIKSKIRNSVPYAVISSNDYHLNSKNQHVRGRKYKWGLVEVDNEDHCDFLALQRTLISENMLDLKFSTEDHYEIYRQRFLQERLEALTKSTGSLNWDYKNNGISEYMLYHRIGLREMEKRLLEGDEVFQYKLSILKDKYNQKIKSQERKFREWKKALIEKQKRLNSDIEEHHSIWVTLKKEIDSLEDLPHGSESPQLSLENGLAPHRYQSTNFSNRF